MIAPCVQHIIKYKQSGTVLDLGTGTGKHALYLAKQGFTVTAVDNDKLKVAELRRRLKQEGVAIKVVRADAMRFAFTKKYDIIIATMLLHFLKPRQIGMLVARIKAHTKSGGLNVVSAYTDIHPLGTKPYLFKKDELKNHYSGWHLLEYEEKKSRPFFSNSAGRLVQPHRAVIIAQK